MRVWRLSNLCPACLGVEAARAVPSTSGSRLSTSDSDAKLSNPYRVSLVIIGALNHLWLTGQCRRYQLVDYCSSYIKPMLFPGLLGTLVTHDGNPMESLSTNNGCNGIAEVWGWKWEKTGTWYGLFNEWTAVSENISSSVCPVCESEALWTRRKVAQGTLQVEVPGNYI